MAGIYDVVDALKEMRNELKAAVGDADAATQAVERYGEARSTTAGMTGTQGTSPGALATALQAQIGRR